MPKLRFNQDWRHTLRKAGSPTILYLEGKSYGVPTPIAMKAIAEGVAVEVGAQRVEVEDVTSESDEAPTRRRKRGR